MIVLLKDSDIVILKTPINAPLEETIDLGVEILFTYNDTYLRSYVSGNVKYTYNLDLIVRGCQTGLSTKDDLETFFEDTKGKVITYINPQAVALEVVILNQPNFTLRREGEYSTNLEVQSV